MSSSEQGVANDADKPRSLITAPLAKVVKIFKMAGLQLSKCHYVVLSFNISAVYIALGLLISLQPPFFPSEAEKMGATPAEYGFVFGIANLSLFIFSPVFGKYGPKIGPKTCFNIGAVLQVLCDFGTYSKFTHPTFLSSTGRFGISIRIFALFANHWAFYRPSLSIKILGRPRHFYGLELRFRHSHEDFSKSCS